MATNAPPKAYNYPKPEPVEIPYKPPKPAANPVVKGLALHYGASLYKPHIPSASAQATAR